MIANTRDRNKSVRHCVERFSKIDILAIFGWMCFFIKYSFHNKQLLSASKILERSRPTLRGLSVILPLPCSSHTISSPSVKTQLFSNPNGAESDHRMPWHRIVASYLEIAPTLIGDKPFSSDFFHGQWLTYSNVHWIQQVVHVNCIGANKFSFFLFSFLLSLK